MEDSRENKTILLVDDSKTQLSFYRIHFTKAGFNVITAENAREAFQRIFEFVPDIVVCDVLMQDVSGFQFCKILKKNIALKNIPVILFTASVDISTNIFWAKQAKADFFISKNVDIAELVDLIKNTIQHSSFTISQKEQIKAHADKAMIIFEENKVVSDIDWMKQIISKEIRNLVRFINDTPLLVSKLFDMLSHILPYNLAFLSFAHMNKDQMLDVYTNFNKIRPNDELLKTLTENFIKEDFTTEKPFKNIEISTDIKNSQTVTSGDYKYHACKKIKNADALVAAISFYWAPPHNLYNISYYDELVGMITQLLQNKAYNENVSFLSCTCPNMGVYNRIQFIENLNVELARTKITNSKLSLAVLSFDNYSGLVDKFSVEAVNLAIEKSIRLITAALRFPDKVYRLNTSTLLVLLVNTDREKAQIPMNRISTILKNTHHLVGDKEFGVDVVATIEDSTLNIQSADMFFEHVLNQHTQKVK